MRRIPPTFHTKAKASVLIAAFLTGVVAILGNTAPFTNDALDATTPGASPIVLDRPSFLQPGNYLNYSFEFRPLTSDETTNITASLRYTFNGQQGDLFNLTESIASLVISYGHTNTNRSLGLYTPAVNRSTIEADLARASKESTPWTPISQYVQLETDLDITRAYASALLVNATNNTLHAISGDSFNAFIVEPNMTGAIKVLTYGHFRTLVSYYRTIATLGVNPNRIYNASTTLVAQGFNYVGETAIDTAFGRRPVVRHVRTLTAPRVETLYFDKYSGILLKAVFRVDALSGLPQHELVYDLVDTNVNLAVDVPLVRNEFEDAMIAIKNYLDTSVLNDTNRSMFYHQTGGDGAVLLDGAKHASDNFQVVKGYSRAFQENMSVLVATIAESKLRDKVNGGLYPYLDAGGNASGNKTVSDAAWAILGSENAGLSSAAFRKDMLDFMETLYKNWTLGLTQRWAFIRTAEQNETFYAYDNAIAFLALQSLARTHPDSTTRTKAGTMASEIGLLFYSTSAQQYDKFWNASRPLWVTAIDNEGFVTEGGDKDIRDNAIIIYALCEYYLHDQTPVLKREGVDRARNAFDILRTKAWVSAAPGGFVTKLSIDNDVLDGERATEENAWMMMAALALLEAVNKKDNKKNITYFDVACETWAFVRDGLQDTQNGTFRHSMTDLTTFAGDLGLLLSPLARMREHAMSMSVAVTTNASEYNFERHTRVNATVLVEFRVYRENPDINFRIPLVYSDVHYVIRYGNMTRYNSYFDVTRPDGRSSFAFPFPEVPFFKDDTFPDETAHQVIVAVNRTGFMATWGSTSFYIVSSIIPTFSDTPMRVQFNTSDTLWVPGDEQGNEIEVPLVFPEEQFSLTLNLSNTATTNQSVRVSLNGTFIANHSSEVVVVPTGASPSVSLAFTFNLTVLGDVEAGLQDLRLVIAKNGSTVSYATIPVFIKLPIAVHSINYARFLIDKDNDGANYAMTLTIKNLNRFRQENASITFSSVHLEAVTNGSANITNLAPLGEFVISLTFRVKVASPLLPSYLFSIKFTWNRDNVGEGVYMVEYRQPVEVFSVSGPSRPLQGRPLLFGVNLRNNRDVASTVQVTITRILENGQPGPAHAFTRSIAPGAASLILSIPAEAISPWDVGVKEYRVEIEQGGTVVSTGTVLCDVQVSLENAIAGYFAFFAGIGVVFLLLVYKKRQIAIERRGMQ